MILERLGPVRRCAMFAYNRGGGMRKYDTVITEEPLEIRVVHHRGGRWVPTPIAVTMRTPGHDFELAAGFLFSEGVIRGRDDIQRLEYSRSERPPKKFNQVELWLKPHAELDTQRLSRHVYTTASCGVCGQASLEWVEKICPGRPVGDFRVKPGLLFRILKKLGGAQPLFRSTGGLHATAVFDARGRLRVLREDIGRHNAMDKVVGWALLERALPLSGHIGLCSGRLSFEMVQKAAMAGLPFMAAVGAPSSLALELARAYGMTLVGFLRHRRFNVYTGNERVVLEP